MLDHGTISQSLVLSTKIWSYVVYVFASRRSIPSDQKFMRRAHALERLDDEMHVVLRFKSRDIKHVTIWLDPPAIHQRIGTAFRLPLRTRSLSTPLGHAQDNIPELLSHR